MVFSSVTFLFYFLPLFLAAYFAVPRRAVPARNLVFAAASTVFYAWGEARFLPLLAGSIALNYGLGLAVARPGRAGGRALAAGVAANLALLGLFKYADLLVAAANPAIEGLGGTPLPLPGLPLPLGISFFTFHAISYLVDVRRGDAAAERDPVRLTLYMLMFPQLIAGPIVRFRQVQGEIRNRRTDAGRFADGIHWFVLGLAQKVLIANSVGRVADQVFAAAPEQLPTAVAWLGTACYTLQIYFDFCGYSLMAYGLAAMVGLTFPPNFDHPYVARSITDFWRRWHISLSAWFRDYLYIPLGGNRRGALVTCRNLLLVFALCGLWHGAAWTFLAWGLYHGAFLVAERLGLGRLLERAWMPLRHLYALAVVMFGWVLFRADGFGQAWTLWGRMLGLGGPAPAAALPLEFYLRWDVVIALAVGAAAATPLPGRAWAAFGRLPRLRAGAGLALGTLAFLLAAAGIASGTYNPFIYFRF